MPGKYIVNIAIVRLFLNTLHLQTRHPQTLTAQDNVPPTNELERFCQRKH